MSQIFLKVVPGLSRDEVVGWLGDALKVKVKAPPEKGRANEAVVALLANRLGVDVSGIVVVSGHGSTTKIVSIEGLADDAIQQTLTCPTLILAASHDEIVPMGDTRKLFEAFRSGVATLRVSDGTDHNSVSGTEEFWDALVKGS